VIEPGEPQPRIFQLLSSTLSALAADQSDQRLSIYVHFVLRLLRLAGFQPQLDECASCGDGAMRQAFWSISQGGALCERCLHHDLNARPLPMGWLEELACCAEADQPPPLSPAQVQAFRQRLDEFLRWRLERPLKTMPR
jgi:DNA repair protein RecO